MRPRLNRCCWPVALGIISSATLAAQNPGSAPGLGDLPNLTPGVESRMVSPENPTGEKGKGAMATPNPSNPDLEHFHKICIP